VRAWVLELQRLSVSEFQSAGFPTFPLKGDIEARKMINVNHMYNKCTTLLSHGMDPTMCRVRDLILVQHQYNNCTTTPHMRVGPSMWDPPSCEGLLYSCCIDVVNLTFSVEFTPYERGVVHLLYI
jgi:hypothetical protein